MMRSALLFAFTLGVATFGLTGCDGSETTATGGSGGDNGMGGGGDTGTGGSGGDTTSTSTEITVPEEIPLDGAAWPEDVTVFEGRVFVSNFATGGIQVYDLAKAPAKAEPFVPAPSSGNLKAFWGMRPMASKGWLLGIANVNYAFDGNVPEPGVVRAYDLATGEEKASWTLPAGTVGNSVDFDAQGNIYVGDVSPQGRILKIEPASNEVSVWKDNTDWGAGPFGHGGMVFDGQDGLYTVTQGALWYVPIQADGSAGKATSIELVDGSGAAFSQVFADGMSWAGANTIYYAQNDAFTAGPQGVVYKVVLDGAGKGTVTPVMEGLKDCSGLYHAEIAGSAYLFVNESQFGHLFQVDAGDPGPFRVLVYPVK